ncbi:MAG TPA: hypothetical protein PK359_00960, partial [Burkholderiaceae bacterium]|nr:hypothetical protein [Burkholderiaceae bacterium]
SFSFAPNLHWSSNYSKRGEVWAYLSDLTERYGLRPHIRFGVEVESLRWDEGRQQWEAHLRGPGDARSVRWAHAVITAVGLVDDVSIMIIAVMASVVVMMVAARPIGEFVDRHPTIKMLALSFLVLVGLVLVAEGFDTHIPKGYVYFAMAFSMSVELLNLRARGRRSAAPVKLKKSIDEPGSH